MLGDTALIQERAKDSGREFSVARGKRNVSPAIGGMFLTPEDHETFS